MFRNQLHNAIASIHWLRDYKRRVRIQKRNNRTRKLIDKIRGGFFLAKINARHERQTPLYRLYKLFQNSTTRERESRLTRAQCNASRRR